MDAGIRLGASLELALVLEDLGPVLDQLVEGFLGRALIGNDVIMQALLHGKQQFGVGRLLPRLGP